MRKLSKSNLRMFLKQATRFFTIVAMVFVSIGLMSGIGSAKDKIDLAINEYYLDQNISDFIFISTNQTGFSSDEIQQISDTFGEDNLQTSFCFDTTIDDKITRIYCYDLNSQTINNLELISGRLPTASNEIVVERKTDTIQSYELNQQISIDLLGMGQSVTYTVVGIVQNPLILTLKNEPSFIEGENIENVIYINNSFLVNNISVTIEDRNLFSSYSLAYEDKINEIKSNINLENTEILTLYENSGLYSMHIYADKIGKIGLIFDLFFMLVTALVIYSTMSRLIDEERGQIACLKTLGYSDSKILGRYLIFILLATIFGSALAFAIGDGLARVLYYAFNMQYSMPEFPIQVSYIYFIVAVIFMLLISLLVTFLSGKRVTSTQPAILLTPKAPKPGKKVILEKIPFIWNKLSFKYKSSFRNVLLFKSRFLMTVISIIGSTILVLSGLGLLDNALKVENSDALVYISVILVVFAGILCALVIYNITNINISERNREISTLMVLGYKDGEVSGYIFREIYIMSIIGAIIGLPLGYAFLSFLFDYISFGSVADVNWWTWVLTPIITIIFAIISSLLLYRKIIKTDMNKSLKILD